MNVLQIFSREPKPEAVDLAELLTDLTRYGQPRLGIYGKGGWHCSVEMNTSAVGVRFEAKSEFEHATPTEAASVCRDRIRAALAAMGKQA